MTLVGRELLETFAHPVRVRISVGIFLMVLVKIVNEILRIHCGTCVIVGDLVHTGHPESGTGEFRDSGGFVDAILVIVIHPELIGLGPLGCHEDNTGSRTGTIN